ncbi:MAG: PD-(D/E)XK nuclease family protein [Sandaracinaceae bacterium]|nr:PD-(D/E)XK nuclease family protein [Sandaracinaceae bacterium]
MDGDKRPLSASQLTAYTMCPRKYRFRYVDRLPSEHRPAALAFGRAVHSALEALHLARLDGASVDSARLVRIFRADWQAEVDQGLSYKTDESANMLRWYGEHLVAEYAKWLADRPLVAAEQPFEIDLVDPETGEVYDERIRGYFDVIFRAEGADVIGEVKTLARRYDEGTLARKIQLSAYAYAWRQMRGRDPTILVVELLKQRQPQVVEATAERSTEDDAFFVRLALDVADAIDAGAFPPNPGWSCGDCEYAKACRRFRGAPALCGADVPPRVGDMVPVGAFLSRVMANAESSAAP